MSDNVAAIVTLVCFLALCAFVLYVTRGDDKE